MKKVFIIGSGGREHALAHAFSQSTSVGTVYVAPGNPGMMDVAQVVDIRIDDLAGLAHFAREQGIDLTFVGPEQPLADGIVDVFLEQGLTIFGPRKKAALIESSKAFAKSLMSKYHIPTADYQTFTTVAPAISYLSQLTAPYVIKADGLAAGKGVIIAETLAEAEARVEDMLAGNTFGQAGAQVVIEEYLVGEEFSFMAFVHEEAVYPLILSKDHKRAFDGDTGPNTGGMGAFAPVDSISQAVIDQAISTILKPTAKAMVSEDRSFTGVLYAGLINTATGPKVIEYNARFGDPETQVILPLLVGDLYQILVDILASKVPMIHFSSGYALGVVMASQGYPGSYQTGLPIEGLSAIQEGYVYHSGTALDQTQLVTNGGRVLVVTQLGDTLDQARERAYTQLGKISNQHLFYRKDIGTCQN